MRGVFHFANEQTNYDDDHHDPTKIVQSDNWKNDFGEFVCEQKIGLNLACVSTHQVGIEYIVSSMYICTYVVRGQQSFDSL